MTIPYGIGPDAEVFKYSLFLVFCNRVVAATIAAITLVVSFSLVLLPDFRSKCLVIIGRQ
jgi:hypothetical protein